jgi:long-chain acyl-CoA synthetase
VRPEPFSSLGALAESLTAIRPEGTAYRAAGRSWTRREIGERARALAGGWLAAGFAPGDVVAIAGDGGASFVLALLSSARAGLVPLVLDTRTTAEEAAIARTRASPKALAACGSPAAPLAEGLEVFAFDEEGCGRLSASAAPLPLTGGADSPALLLLTSGTTGRPGVVTLTAGNVLADLEAAYEVHPAEPGDVFLSLLPASHAFELVPGLLGALWIGATIARPSTRIPGRLLALANAEGVTRVFLVPSLVRMMADEIREAGTARRMLVELRGRLRSVICGGAPIAPSLVENVVEAGIPLWLGYGLTEASPIVALGPAAEIPAGSSGKALPGVEVRIEERTGEVLVRGPNVMRGYAGDPVGTEEALCDGWLHTGDLGRLDGGGHLFLTGRRKDLIVTAGGEKVSPEEVELAYESSLFEEICVVGIPDPDGGGGEKPCLAVVAKAGAGGGSAVLREEFVRLSLRAGRRRAFGMTVLPAPLPRTRTGKVRRDLVRDRIRHAIEGARP